MFKPISVTAIAMGLVACGATSSSYAETYSCTAEKHTITHMMDVSIQNGKLSSFEYSSATPVSGSVNNCTIDSHRTKTEVSPAGVQTYTWPTGDKAFVSKKGEQYLFDFSKLSVSNFCGQSSAIARHLTITPGSKKCSGIDDSNSDSQNFSVD